MKNRFHDFSSFFNGFHDAKGGCARGARVEVLPEARQVAVVPRGAYINYIPVKIMKNHSKSMKNA